MCEFTQDCNHLYDGEKQLFEFTQHKAIQVISKKGGQDVYVGPQIGTNPIPILGLPNLEINSGSPRSDMGIAFLVFFFSHAQDRPFLTKN